MSGAEAQAIHLLIADEHQAARIGLRAIFAPAPDIAVAGEAGSVAGAIAETVRLNPAVVLMGMHFPDGSGVDACREILAARPQTRILFLTPRKDEEAILPALLAGASGYLLNDTGEHALVLAVKSVAAGQLVLDPEAVKVIRERLQSVSETPASTARSELISPQEQRVLALVAQGKTNREIAAALDLSEKTVKNYLRNIFKKLQVSRRAEAAAIFSRHFTR